MIPKQVKDVGDGGERIVDFVRDDSGHATHRRQLFCFAQRLFGVQLRGDVAAHLQHRIAFVVHDLAAGNDDLGAVLFLLEQVSLPDLAFAQHGFDLFARNRKDGLQDGVNVLAANFLALPAV